MENLTSHSCADSEKQSEIKVDAIVLAGGDGSVIDPQTAVKGMVKIAGKPMVQWVVEALRQAKHVDKIAVVLPPGQDMSSWEHLVDHMVLNDGLVSDNIIKAKNALDSDCFIISITSDIPSVTPAAIDSFIELTLQRGVDISYPYIREAVMESAYPDSERTYFKIDGNKVTGGNAMMLESKHFDHLREVGQELFESRKNPIKMANMVGASLALKLVTGKLSSADLEERVGKIIKLKCAAIVIDDASIAADVDKPEDVAVVEAKLKQAKAG